jgi:hypothetical protein
VTKRTSRLLAVILLCALGRADAISKADEPVKSGENRDTLLYVRTDPPGAKVFLNGKELGTSDGLFRVEPGNGTIFVEVEGRKMGQRQVIVRANGITRVELKLTPQADAKAAGPQSTGGPSRRPLQPVYCTIGVKHFRNGDSINIDEVKATSPDLKKGDKVVVKGTYALASEPKASLGLFATSTKDSVPSQTFPEQRLEIAKGKGNFELSEILTCDGYLHVTFYSAITGKSFGGVYFGTAKQMKEIEHWQVRSWYGADSAASPSASDAIVEGVGWKDARLGMSREDLIKALGKPDNDSTSDWLKWSDKHIDCSFYTGSPVVCEVHFNPGFEAALANGIKLGSSGSEMLRSYGEPEFTFDRQNGAKQYGYTEKGILFWTFQGKISQIVVFKPRSLADDKAPPGSRYDRATLLRTAKAGDFAAKYELWAVYHKGLRGVQKDPEKAQKYLAELVKGMHVATFRPAEGFAPRTPRELLTNFNEHSGPQSGGGSMFFRTRAENGVLIGSFLTLYPDKMRAAIEANPSLKLVSIEEMTPEKFISYEASPQQSLDAGKLPQSTSPGDRKDR